MPPGNRAPANIWPARSPISIEEGAEGNGQEFGSALQSAFVERVQTRNAALQPAQQPGRTIRTPQEALQGTCAAMTAA